MENKHVILLICAALIIMIPFALNIENKGGTDDIASDEMKKSGYTPWLNSILNNPGEEMENLILISQAVFGLIIIGFFVGYYKKKQNS